MNFVYTWCVDRVAPDKREEWDFQMNAPLPGRKTMTETATQDEGDGFMAAMAQIKGA